MPNLKRSFDYAQRHGFSGGYVEYVKINYEGYVGTCNRCEIEPKSFEEWLDGQF